MARAYVIAGLGLYRQEAEAVLYGQPIEGSETDFGMAGGFGVSLRLGGVRGLVEARVHNIFGEGESARIYPVTVGLVF